MKHAVYDKDNNIVRPVFQLGYKEDGTLVSLVRDDVDGCFGVKDGRLYFYYGKDNLLEDIQATALKFGLIESTDVVESKAQLYNILTQKALDTNLITIGNVDVYIPGTGFRIPVQDSILINNDWTISEWPESWGYQTLFAQTKYNDNCCIVATPILSDGSVLPKSEFNSYLSDCLSQENILDYDKQHNSIVLGVADNKEEGNVFIKLLTEWEDNLLSASIPVEGEGREYYNDIIAAAMDNQDSDIEDICEPLNITDDNIIDVVNAMYPVFNCQKNQTNVAWGRLRRLLFHELWIIVSTGKE